MPAARGGPGRLAAAGSGGLTLAIALGIAGAMAGPGAAWAQAGASILDQNRADRAPPTAPSAPLAVRAAPTKAEGPQSAVSPFVLRAVRIEGGTIPPALLQPAWAPFVGRTVGEPELKTLADAVAAAYGRSDVALYTVVTPRQTFEGGVVQLAVIEGYVEDIRLSGDGAGRLVQAYARKMQRQLPLRRSKLERYLSLIRDIPGIRIDVQLLRGSTPGAVVLQIVAHRKRVEEGLSVNNRGTAYLGRNQIKADLWLDGLLRQGDQTRLTFAAPTDFDRFHYYGAAQLFALDTEGTTATLGGGYITTRPAFTTLRGTADSWSLQVSHPVIRAYQSNLYLTGDIDGVDSTNTAYGQELYTERVRTLRGAAAYSRQTDIKSLSLSSTLSFGLNGLGAQIAAPGWSKANFVKLNAAAKWNHAIGKHWVIRLDAAGQYSGDKLPGSEQFSLGGDEFGRAFPAAITTGDQGAAGSAELAYRPEKLPAVLAGSEAYGFVDGGQVRWQARPFAPGYTQGLSSMGVGTRFAILSKGVLEFELADALSAPLPTESGGWRMTVSVRSLMN